MLTHSPSNRADQQSFCVEPIVAEIPLSVAQEFWFVYAKIAARNHRQVVGVGVVIQIAEIAEDRTLLGEALQEITFMAES